jgi:predicted ABC-type ATPase
MSKRLRVFAGPNGSGKSSIIQNILNTEVKPGVKLDFGIYINADEIANDLRKNYCDFTKYQINFIETEFFKIASESGLINEEFNQKRFERCISINNKSLNIIEEVAKENDDTPHERIAQIIADYLRKKLLSEEKKFSFETVFSHPGKVEIIKQAKDAGYKVYLYFISTEHPKINIYRVKVVRVGENGHDVDQDKIVSRYYRSMNLLYEAAQSCYQAYFFDNSVEGSNLTMFAHFKLNAEGEKVWDKVEQNSYPNWFIKYYSKKIERK